MQTDAYDPDEFGGFEESDTGRGRGQQTDAFAETGALGLDEQDDGGATVPVDMGEWIRQDSADADGRAADGR